MARVLNLIIVIMEVIGFSKSLKRRSLKDHLIYYTQISNLFTFVSSLLIILLGQKEFIEIFRYISVCMLMMTVFVTVCILVPITKKPKELLFSGSGLFHHLLIPIVSILSYLLFERRVDLIYAWIPVTVTLIYGIVMILLNYRKKIDGPYPFFRIREMGTKLTVIRMVCLMVVTGIISVLVGYHKPMKTDIRFIYVHGLSGWGSYDLRYEFYPYWGLLDGDVVRYMNEQGYESYAASVDPKGSAWDRACELYAQLNGTRVDYGAAHSQKAGHDRYGRDYSKDPLVQDLNGSKYVLIGHSFGGATVRLYSELIRNGSAEEIDNTDPSELSDFFKGGMGDDLLAIVTLAAPTNGTTAYDLYEDDTFDRSEIYIPEEYMKASENLSKATKTESDGREDWDYAAFDMHIDNALSLNERITTFDDVYYFAYPCSSTTVGESGQTEPDPMITERTFMKGSTYMSRYTGYTKGGFRIDETWQSNDGLVNEVSARAPFGALSKEFEDGDDLKPGVWYIMPVTKGDHMSLQGGLTKRVSVKPFYLELARLISELKD
ncbi:MAG: hypothetical protein K6F34_05720 [Lachnospiraceae bacterium]|nr:hypothetical protein [Lachnospiraceae bacterium]